MSLQKALRAGRERRDITWTDAATNLVFDGNSIVAGAHATTTPNRLPGRVCAYPPISGGITSPTNLGINGQTTQMMNGLNGGSAADVDGAWVGGKTNVLVAWEGTNSNGGPTAAAAMQSYVANRLAANAWIVVLIGTIPRYEGTDPDGYNNRLVEYNRICSASWKSWGCAAYVDPRPKGGPFDLPDWTLASFERAQTVALYSTSDTAGVRTHLSDAGFAYVGRLVAAALRRL